MSIENTDTQARPDARHAGAQKVFFACFTELGQAALDDVQRMVPVHKEWIAKQECLGNIFVAGPFLTADYSYAGSGLIVFRAETAAEAHALAEQDPMHANGLRTFRIIPWQLNEGSVQVSMTFSKGVFEFS